MLSRIALDLATVHDTLGVPFDLVSALDDIDADLTDEHPSSSYGLPVVVFRGRAYGPGDLSNAVLHVGRDTAEISIASARAAGWAIEELYFCAHCGDRVSMREPRLCEQCEDRS